MSIASRIKWYLEVNRVKYEILEHPYTETSRETAEQAHIPSTKLAKAVLLEDQHGYVMPILPASRRLDLDKVQRRLKRDLKLASEREATQLFFDCEEGAIPPMGSAYGIPTIVDDSLLDAADIYFEGGDHVDLVHLEGSDFFSLIPDADHADLTS